jgi:hypothetical protein
MSIVRTSPAKAAAVRQRPGGGRAAAWWRYRARACRAAAEAGMSTAEYAVGTGVDLTRF